MSSLVLSWGLQSGSCLGSCAAWLIARGGLSGLLLMCWLGSCPWDWSQVGLLGRVTSHLWSLYFSTNHVQKKQPWHLGSRSSQLVLTAGCQPFLSQKAGVSFQSL